MNSHWPTWPGGFTLTLNRPKNLVPSGAEPPPSMLEYSMLVVPVGVAVPLRNENNVSAVMSLFSGLASKAECACDDLILRSTLSVLALLISQNALRVNGPIR